MSGRPAVPTPSHRLISSSGNITMVTMAQPKYNEPAMGDPVETLEIFLSSLERTISLWFTIGETVVVQK